MEPTPIIDSTCISQDVESDNLLLQLIEDNDWLTEEEDANSPNNTVIFQSETSKVTSKKKKAPVRRKQTSKKKHQGPKPPKKPLSAYNIYFQFERLRILRKEDHEPPFVNQAIAQKALDDFKSRPPRKHRKSHGQISFLTLSKTVSARWNALDPLLQQPFKDVAKVEAQHRQKLYQEWKAKYGDKNKQAYAPMEENENDFSEESTNTSVRGEVAVNEDNVRRGAEKTGSLHGPSSQWPAAATIAMDRLQSPRSFSYGVGLRSKTQDSISHSPQEQKMETFSPWRSTFVARSGIGTRHCNHGPPPPRGVCPPRNQEQTNDVAGDDNQVMIKMLPLASPPQLFNNSTTTSLLQAPPRSLPPHLAMPPKPSIMPDFARSSPLQCHQNKKENQALTFAALSSIPSSSPHHRQVQRNH